MASQEVRRQLDLFGAASEAEPDTETSSTSLVAKKRKAAPAPGNKRAGKKDAAGKAGSGRAGSRTDAKAAPRAAGKKPRRAAADPMADTGDGETVAHRMAAKQRQISVSEFFTKNRHLLGFDNPRKAILTAIKEAVDNSLDACEEAQILPDITVEIHPTKREDRFRVVIEDNGPGIVKAQLPEIFARLLYGSKFHSLKQQRGQQGIGISAAAMYGQMTTGRPVSVISRIGKRHPAHYLELKIDTAKNRPEVVREMDTDWDKPHGTRIELELEARVQRGKQSVDEYLSQTAVANPHLELTYKNWEGETTVYQRATKERPVPAKEIKPHPYGVEVGLLGNMVKLSEAKKLGPFLRDEFSRVSPRVAAEICKIAGVTTDTWLKSLNDDQIEKLQGAMQAVKLMAPATDCVTPIGEKGLLAGLQKEVEADLYLAHTRSPKIYRGNPFVIETALAYGGSLAADDSIRTLRLANRVPLLYQQGACACTKAIVTTDWRKYMLQQPRGALPVGPMVVVIHLASVWVPFTSEAKEAVAHYPEILKEMRLALQEMGRKVASHIRKQRRIADQLKKKSYIEAYLPPIGEALRDILGLNEAQTNKTVTNLTEILEKSRKLG